MSYHKFYPSICDDINITSFAIIYTSAIIISLLIVINHLTVNYNYRYYNGTNLDVDYDILIGTIIITLIIIDS